MRLYFWRTQAGNEVDFVLYGAGGFHALEIKNTRSVRPEDLRGLKSLRGDYPECTTTLLYRGDEAIERDGILCLPVDAFLRELTPAGPLPLVS